MLRNYVHSKSISKPNIRASSLYALYLKRGSAIGGRDESRAPSTAEEFTRQGVASQTVEKAYDGVAPATNVSGDSEAETEEVKEKFKEKEESKDYHKTGDDGGGGGGGGLPINTSKGI